jgi:hypothetical protein
MGQVAWTLRPGFVFLAVAGPLFALYLMTAVRGLPYHIDPLTNVFSAWTIATTGSPVLHDYAEYAAEDQRERGAWIVDSERGPVSQYPPGTALLAAPAYALFSRDAGEVLLRSEAPDAPEPVIAPLPSLLPAAAISALTTAVAVGLLAVAFHTVAPTSWALLSAYTFGLGTGAWSVASNALWQHGPAMMWIALAVLLSAAEKWLPSGLAMGAAVLTRPPTAVIAAALGVHASLHRRQWKPVIFVGLGSGVGLAFYLVYNRLLFGTWTLRGGYSGVFQQNVISMEFVAYLRNVALSLVDKDFGVLIYSPFVLVSMLGLRSAWRQAPGWAKAGAIGGILYLAILLRANRFTGGGSFLFYRYPLEALTAAAPLILLSAMATARRGRLIAVILAISAIAAIAVHAWAAIGV